MPHQSPLFHEVEEWRCGAHSNFICNFTNIRSLVSLFLVECGFLMENVIRTFTFYSFIFHQDFSPMIFIWNIWTSENTWKTKYQIIQNLVLRLLTKIVNSQIIMLLNKQMSALQWEAKYIDYILFKIGRGVRQGETISPNLFETTPKDVFKILGL